MSDKTALYSVQRPRFVHDGERKTTGDTVLLSERQAKPLLAVGAITPAPAQGAKAATKEFTPAETAQGVATVETATSGTAPVPARRRKVAAKAKAG